MVFHSEEIYDRRDSMRILRLGVALRIGRKLIPVRIPAGGGSRLDVGVKDGSSGKTIPFRRNDALRDTEDVLDGIEAAGSGEGRIGRHDDLAAGDTPENE
jgi:hypothetical protein